MAVRTKPLRNGLLTALVVASVVTVGSLAGAASQPDASVDAESAAIQQDAAAFSNRTVVEQRGDVAEFAILFDETDRATVTVGSPDVNFVVSFAVVDRDGDGEATVEFNTAVAGLKEGADGAGIRALGADEIADYEMTTDPILGPLDAAVYDLELSVDDQLVDVGVLVLDERATGTMTVLTAPDAARPNDSAAFLETITRTDRIARGDWVVLAIEVSGVFGYVEDAGDLADPANGLNLTVSEDPGLNRPERRVDLDGLRVVPDATNDTLFVLLDTDDLNATSEYEATFAVTDANPYVEAGEEETANATFSVVEPRPTGGEGTTAADETTEANTEERIRTTTTASSANVAGAGPTEGSVGFFALLVGATLVVLRWR